MIDPGTIRRLQKELQERIEKNRDTLGDQTVEGSAGGGVITVVCNGNQELTEVRIKPEAVDPDDVEMLQDLILAATNQAMEKAKKLHEDSVSDITGGLRFPGLF